MLEFLIEIDEKVLLFFNGMHTPWADHFMMDITGKAIWLPFYVVLALALVWRYGWLRGLAIVALVGVAVGCADAVADNLIRPYIQRLRPSNLENELSALVQVIIDEKHPAGYRSSAYGFPSCHAANTLALAVASGMAMRRLPYIIFIFIWAALLCYSRIYLGVHYPGDIAAGAIIGALFGWLFGWLATKLTKNAPKPKHPSNALTLTTWAPIAVGALTLIFAAIVA